MKRLGELLVERGWITRADLSRALSTQQAVGGSLGSCLLETGAVGEELLHRALAEQHEVEPAPLSELREIPEEVLAGIPAKLAVRHGAVPFRRDPRQLHVAIASPRDLTALDEIAFVSGRSVRPYAISEARLCEALERHYGERCPARIATLLDRLNRQRYLWGKTDSEPVAELFEPAPELVPPPPLAASTGRHATLAAGAPASAESTAPAAPGDSSVRMRRPSSVTLSEAERVTLFAGGDAAPAPPAAATPSTAPVPTGAAGPAPPSPGTAGPESPAPAPTRAVEPPWTEPPRTESPRTGPRPVPDLGAAAAGRGAPPARTATAHGAAASPSTPQPAGRDGDRFAAAHDRDEVGRSLLGALAEHLERVILFGVHRDTASGWMAFGDGLSTAAVSGFSLVFDRPSVLFNLRQGSALHVGPLPPMPAHRDLVALLGGEEPPDCVLLPVRIGSRMVAAIYGDNGERSLGAFDLEALRSLARDAADALERCILLKRQGQSDPSVG